MSLTIGTHLLGLEVIEGDDTCPRLVDQCADLGNSREHGCITRITG